jgi:AcrR family transcriptional regulator
LTLEPELENGDTKSRIMDAAEGLFAEHGYAAASLREITSQAGANLAAVNYHFQSKEGLLEAILARHFGPINLERLAALSAAEEAAGRKAPDLEAVLRAFLEPPFRTFARPGDRGVRLLQFLGRMHMETGEQVGSIFQRQFAEVFERFSLAFRRALPDLGADEGAWRIHFVLGAMAHTLLWSRKGDARSGHSASGDPEALLAWLVQFCVAGLQAPGVAKAARRKR